MNQESTITFANTLDPEGNSRLVILERLEGTLPTIPVNPAPNDCSSDPLNTICGFGAGIGITTGVDLTIFGNNAGANTNINTSVFIGSGAGEFSTNGVRSMGMGYRALRNSSSRTSIGNNTAVGWQSQTNAIDSGFCTSLGATTLELLQTGIGNTAIGAATLSSLLTGNNCTGIGSSCLLNLGGAGTDNTCIGQASMLSKTSGDRNTTIGKSSGSGNLSGSDNIYVGERAGVEHKGAESGNIMIGNVGTLGDNNITRIGIPGTTLEAHIAGVFSVTPTGGGDEMMIMDSLGQTGTQVIPTGDVIGPGSSTDEAIARFDGTTGKLLQNSIITIDDDGDFFESGTVFLHMRGGGSNTGVGADALGNIISSGGSNTACGKQSLLLLTSGDLNTAIGFNSGAKITTADSNTCVGYRALDQVTGDSNTGLGIRAGNLLTTGTNNICINNAGVAGEGRKIRIGTFGTQENCFIAGIAGVTPASSLEMVIIDSTTGELGSQIVSPTDQMSTGLISGGEMTVDIDTTEFSISDGRGFIRNVTTDILTEVEWTGLTAQSTTYVGFLTFVSLSSIGTPVYSTTNPTNSEIRENIFLGILGHPDAINISFIEGIPCVIENSVNSLRDLYIGLASLNLSGNTVSAAQTDLSIAKTAGKMMRFGANYYNDIADPHVVSISSFNSDTGANTYNLVYQDSSARFGISDIIPGQYDNGGGESSPGVVPNNDFSVQRVYIFSANSQMVISPAQFVYNTSTEAIAAIYTEGFIVQQNNADDAILVGFIAVRGAATNLSLITDAIFLKVNKFGAISN